MADIASMYAMLCDVQQCAAQEEETVKQLKADVHRFREAKDALSASVQSLQSDIDGHRATIALHQNNFDASRFEVRTALDACRALRQARSATFDTHAQLTGDADLVWQQLLGNLRTDSALHAQKRRLLQVPRPPTPANEGSGGVLPIAAFPGGSSASISQKFQIRLSGGSGVKKTLFSFR